MRSHNLAGLKINCTLQRRKTVAFTDDRKISVGLNVTISAKFYDKLNTPTLITCKQYPWEPNENSFHAHLSSWRYRPILKMPKLNICLPYFMAICVLKLFSTLKLNQKIWKLCRSTFCICFVINIVSHISIFHFDMTSWGGVKKVMTWSPVISLNLIH